MKKNRCPFCPKSFQSKNDMHRHIVKIHNINMSDDDLDSIWKELTIGDICNWDENKLIVKGEK